MTGTSRERQPGSSGSLGRIVVVTGRVEVDVFSDIFGKADASVPQPLNPAHQSKGPAGISGRSLPRRGRPSQ